MNNSENKKTELPKEIKVYIYDKNIINGIINMLEKLKVEGIEQASLLSEIGRFIHSPIKEDSMQIENNDIE